MNKKLKVWWIPQVPGKSFEVEVNSVEQGAFLLSVFADYDRFQYENQIKSDYCNGGGLMQEYEPGEWEDWQDDEIGETDPIEWVAQKLSQP